MEKQETNKPDYRNYSEIDHLLGSELAQTPWGVDSLLQRLPLFDKPKRHIPYILLLHLVYYNPDFEAGQKKTVINRLIKQLYKDVIKGSKRNQLLDFLPPYYFIHLLIDLHMSGYNINSLNKNLDIEDESDPFRKLLEYGDCSVPGFPEALILLNKKMDRYRKQRDKFLFDISLACLRANNFSGFHHIYKNFKSENYKLSALHYKVLAYVELNEMDKAFRIINAVSPIENNDVMYLDMSLLLAIQGKIDIIREIRRTAPAPEQVFATLCGMIAYHLKNKDIPSAQAILDEASQVLVKIKNYYIRTMRQLLLFDFALQCGDNRIADKSLDKATFYIESFSKTYEEKSNAQLFLLRKLISHKRLEQAKELNFKWKHAEKGQEEFWIEHNMNVAFQLVAEWELMIIAVYRRHDYLFGYQRKSKAGDYYDTVLNVTRLIEGEDYRRETLFVVAKHIAKSGLYQLAIETKMDIPGEACSDSFDKALPMYALSRGDLKEALDFANLIKEEKDKLDVLLCMSPHLEKKNQSALARQFIREWAVHVFRNS